MRYRLLLDPFGPVGLAKAIVRQVEPANPRVRSRMQAATVAAFSLSEVALTMAHVAARMTRQRDGGPDLMPVFRELSASLNEFTAAVVSDAELDVRDTPNW